MARWSWAMNELIVSAASRVSEAELQSVRLGLRFGRLDLMSKLAVAAVEELRVDFGSRARDRIGICLGARAGSLSTDVQYWKRREAVGGPSPTLFAYTLPSAALGEIAIRYRLTGPTSTAECACHYSEIRSGAAPAKHAHRQPKKQTRRARHRARRVFGPVLTRFFEPIRS